MSNLIKSGVVAINSKEKRIIDSDSRFDAGFRPLVFEKIEEIGGLEEADPEEETAAAEERPEEGGLTQEQTDLLFRADSDEAAIQMLMGRQKDTGGKKGDSSKKEPKKEAKNAKPSIPSKQAEQEIKEAKEKADKILAEANAQAEEIIAQAQEEARRLTENAHQEGYEDGYREGQDQVESEIADARAQLEAEKKRLKEEYRTQLSTLEPQAVDLVCEIVKKLTGVVLSERKDIMTHLVSSCLEEMERSKVYLIHVSREDFPDLQERKKELEDMIGEESEIKIVEDASLSKNQCLIESDTSIYDSSLDLQLERLCEDLKILSMDVALSEKFSAS